MIHTYVAVFDDMAVRSDGLELRRASTDEWAAFETWCETNAPSSNFSTEEWAALPERSRGRLSHVAPAVVAQEGAHGLDGDGELLGDPVPDAEMEGVDP